MAKTPSFKVDLALLKSSIQRQLDRTEKNRFRDKFRTSAATIATAFGGAMTSTLIGLSKFFEPAENILQASALIVSGIMAVVVAWDHLFDHKKLWVISSKGNRRFKELIEDIGHAEATDSLTEEQAQAFYLEYKGILADMNGQWDRLRGSAEK